MHQPPGSHFSRPLREVGSTWSLGLNILALTSVTTPRVERTLPSTSLRAGSVRCLGLSFPQQLPEHWAALAF